MAAGAGASRQADGEREEVADATNVLLLRRFNRFGRLKNLRQFLKLISCFKNFSKVRKVCVSRK